MATGNENQKQTIRVLLLEDDAGDALLVQEMLAEINPQTFAVTHADRAAKAMTEMAAGVFDIILLDLSLPDGHGLELVERVRQAAPETPIVVMSGMRDEELAVRLVQEGVQDYCVKGHVDSFLLGRSLRYAIERKRIEDELRRTNAELAILFQVSSMASRSVEMNFLLADTIETITGMNMLNLERKGAVLLMNDGGHLRLAYEFGHDQEFFRTHQAIATGECLCGMVAASGEMAVEADACSCECHTIKYAGMEPHGHIIIPLKIRQQVIGVLCLYTAPNTRVDENERKLLMSIGEQISIAIDNARLYEATRQLALHDPLTGLANRRHLDIVAEGNLAMARRYGTPFAIILLDLDYFKEYNDTHGHSAGDQLLVAVAMTLKHEVRDTNLVVRYGGEEFLLLLPDTQFWAAMAVAERTRIKLLAATGVTVSMGVAWAKEGVGSMAELVAAADTALYQAKNGGRNRVVGRESPVTGKGQEATMPDPHRDLGPGTA